MQKRFKVMALAVIAVSLGVTLAGCTSDDTKGNPGTNIADNRQNYTPKNDVEGHNYNARQAIADNPATLIWCTVFPTSPNAKAFTIPIVGKLTSGNKRPYPTEQAVIDSDTGGYTYNPEVPGPDGMFGTSGEYRYGFDPAGNYHDFYNLETYCTTVPNVLQKEQTIVVIKAAGDLGAIDKQVEAALAACRAKDPDPSHTCPEAARLLGV
jgi:hypothetical protein